MRVLMIAHSNAPWTPNFCRMFQERGDELLLVSFAPFPLDGVTGVPVEFVGSQSWDMHGNKHVYITRIPRVRQLIKRYRPDVIFAPYVASNGMTAVLSWRGPTVVAAVGSDVLSAMEGGGWKRSIRRALLGFICRRAALINTVSHELTEAVVRLGADRARVLEQSFGFDAERFWPDPAMPRTEAAKIVCTRKHEPLYDIATIIAALGRLRAAGHPFTATLACAGSLLERHRELVEQISLQNQVAFTGQLPHDQIPGLLRQGDLYVSASTTDGTSVSLLEALASGLFPVVSDIRANRPWIEHGKNGLLFPVGDAHALTEALVRALRDRELRCAAFQHNLELVRTKANMLDNFRRLAAAMEQVAAAGLIPDGGARSRVSAGPPKSGLNQETRK